MDVLSDVLSAMRAGRVAAGRTLTRAPWGMRFPAAEAACCHVILRGSCYLVPATGEPVRLNVGDVVLASSRYEHTLVDELGSPVTDFDPGRASDVPFPEVETPGPGAATEMLCASYSFDDARPHPLFDDLPAVIHLPCRVGYHPALRSTVELLGNELNEPRAGTTAILPSLIDMLLLYVLRAWLDDETRSGRAAGWVAALSDPAIATALQRIHRRPGEPWTVEALAAEAGLSRAAFAKRFTGAIGRPPLTYLTWWRMTTAARLLRDSQASLQAVAERCGYGSEYAFAKAFKREYGMAPGRYRRQARTRPSH